MSADLSTHDFLEMWFGPLARRDCAADLVGPLLRQNDLVVDPWRDGDVEVLVCENQGVWLWGRTSDGRFVERENLRDQPWTPTGEDEDQFWLHHAALEALLAMPAARCGRLTEATSLHRLEAFSSPVPCGEWRWMGGQHVRHHQATVVTVWRDDDGAVEVMAGGHSERELAWIDGLGIEWSIVDSRS